MEDGSLLIQSSLENQTGTQNDVPIVPSLPDDNKSSKSKNLKKQAKKEPKQSNQKKQTKGNKDKISSSTRAGLQFPVGRIHRYLRNAQQLERVSIAAAVYLAAVLEYLTAEVLELAGNVSNELKVKRITPRHILLAVKNDSELNTLFKNITIPQAGVNPHIHELLKKTKAQEN